MVVIEVCFPVIVVGMSEDGAPFTNEQQQVLKEMLAEAVQEALQVVKEKAQRVDGENQPTQDPEKQDAAGGSGKL